jgi:flagellar assembly factor FliW
MPQCESAQFGTLEYDEAAVVHFPAGLPAFESETRFLLIEQTETAPVVFLQSLATPRLLFLAVPAGVVDASFRVELLPEERALLEVNGSDDYVTLVILTVREGRPATANMLAPLVIAARSRRALQIIQAESGYSVEEPCL